MLKDGAFLQRWGKRQGSPLLALCVISGGYTETYGTMSLTCLRVKTNACHCSGWNLSLLQVALKKWVPSLWGLLCWLWGPRCGRVHTLPLLFPSLHTGLWQGLWSLATAHCLQGVIVPHCAALLRIFLRRCPICHSYEEVSHLLRTGDAWPTLCLLPAPQPPLLFSCFVLLSRMSSIQESS